MNLTPACASLALPLLAACSPQTSPVGTTKLSQQIQPSPIGSSRLNADTPLAWNQLVPLW